MPIPSPYGIETLSIYRDRDLRHRRRPRPRRDQDKNQGKDLETAILAFAETPLGKADEVRTVSAMGLRRVIAKLANVHALQRGFGNGSH